MAAASLPYGDRSALANPRRIIAFFRQHSGRMPFKIKGTLRCALIESNNDDAGGSPIGPGDDGRSRRTNK